MKTYLLVQEAHRLAREPRRLLLPVGGGRIGTQGRQVVEDMFAVLAAHDRYDDRTAALHGEHRPRVRDVRLAAEEVDLDVGLRHAQVGQDREGAPRLEPPVDLHQGLRAPALHDLDVAVLALHPGVDLRIALPGGDGEEREAVLGHRPRGHVPVAGMGHHDDDALPFVDERLEAVLVHPSVQDVAVHPPLRQPGRPDHLDAGLEDVREAPPGDAPELALGLLREDAPQAVHRPRPLQAQDVERAPGVERREEQRHAVGDEVDESAEEAEDAILQVDGQCAFRGHRVIPKPCRGNPSRWRRRRRA